MTDQLDIFTALEANDRAERAAHLPRTSRQLARPQTAGDLKFPPLSLSSSTSSTTPAKLRRSRPRLAASPPI